jgi:multidrug efflux pump subunit AcrA (membrane-fusion protein)
MELARKSSVALDDPSVYALIALVVALAGGLAFFVLRSRGKKRQKPEEMWEERPRADLAGLPFKVVKSVPREDASQAKNELRMLDLEREILSDAIRRLYEAQAEGKITEEERERLAQTYKARMMAVKDAITKDESVVALHELESMQEDLIKLFSERFDELTGKIDELRTRVDVKPIKEIAIPTEKPTFPEDLEEKSPEEEKAKKRRRPTQAKTTPRSEAEKRIDEIRAEVEKVLDRLGQMEVEG